MRQVPDLEPPTIRAFRNDIVPAAQPAVLRDVAGSWPLTAAAKRDTAACMALLSAHATAEPVKILQADPGEDERFHYGPDGKSLNFIQGRTSLAIFLDALLKQMASDRPYSMVAQGLIAERYFPDFASAHPMPFAPALSEPRFWIGNAAKVATHKDATDNLAVVAAGRRRFTLFPPEAEASLYMGPTHPTPAGTPVSMVHVTAPDLDRFPKFEAALQIAQEAELAPGDAIFIPAGWFHHVESLERFNILVNYWSEPGS